MYGSYKNLSDQLLEKDPTRRIKSNALKQLKFLKDKKFIDNKSYWYLRSRDSFAPRFYIQLKMNKPGVCIRIIASYNGSPLYNLSKYIANILQAYIEDKNNNSKNSTRFLSYIRNVSTEDDKIMVSFDVTFLYTFQWPIYLGKRLFIKADFLI